MLTYIYKLVDPVTLECRYIGKSIIPKERYTRHLYEAKKLSRKNYLYCWINSLLKKDLKPNIEIIDLVDDWIFWEKFYISYYKKLGCKLTNLCDGGQGNPGWKHTEQWKQDQSKRYKGRKPWNTNQKLSEEHKFNIGLSSLNRVVSINTRAKISLGNIIAKRSKSKLTEQDIKDIKSSNLKQKELAKIYNCNQSHINRIINNKIRIFCN